MIKILKKLKPYLGLIILIAIMVTGISFSSLFLPDRMSKIIGEGIVAEVAIEEKDGEQINIKIDMPNSGIPIMEMPLPKVAYEGAGQLVTVRENGKLYAIIIGTEKNENGEDITFLNPTSGDYIIIPQFLRTVDGTMDAQPMQGKLLLDENGSPQLSYIQKSNLPVIWKNGGIMLGITFFSSILSIIVAYMSSKVGTGFGRDLRKQLFEKIINFSKAQDDKFSTASLITRTTNDVMQMQMFTIMSLRMMLNVPIMFAGGLFMALQKDAKMTLVLVFTIPLVLITIGFVAKRVMPIFKSVQKRVDRLTMVARENITGVRVIKAFGGEEYEDKRFKDANKDVTASSLSAARYMSVLMPLMMLIMSVTSITIVFISAKNIDRSLQQNMLDFTKIGNMMAVIQYIMQIMMSVIMFSVIFIMLPRASVSATRINEVLETDPNIFDPDEPQTGIRKGEVEFENVSFSYTDGCCQNVLEDISFIAKKGTTTAIIGGTGSGKSTLINLIPRQYDVTKGKIKVDGIDVRDYALKDLRSRIGFVTQNAILFSGNIKTNVLYGAKDEANFEQAVEIAQAKKFIEEKDGGTEAIVEQGGRNFSGGQKQRISIARALATDADILVLDDSFSALDFATDMKLRTELAKVTKQKAVIIVAQRIGTVMDADNIIVLDKGKIVGIGKHKDLLRECIEYKDIALSQLSEKELGISGGK